MSAREKARGLINIALDKRGEPKERRVAAMNACKLIEKYDLLSSPLDGMLDNDNDTVQAAKTLFKTISDPALVNSVKKIASRFKTR